MVFFVCYHCGECIKKPAVEKHYMTKCRGAEPNLTCQDCLKDFRGNAYDLHIKCVTEEERYSAKGFVPKPTDQKGEKKQKAWSEIISSLAESSSLRPDEKTLMKMLCNHDNVPRKKQKFERFIQNACKQFASRKNVVDAVWEHIEKAFTIATQSESIVVEPAVATKPVEQTEEKMKKKKKTNCVPESEVSGAEEKKKSKRKHNDPDNENEIKKPKIKKEMNGHSEIEQPGEKKLTEEKSKKKKKIKPQPTNDEDLAVQDNTKEHEPWLFPGFDKSWESTILKILRKKKNKNMKFSVLQDKLIEHYVNFDAFKNKAKEEIEKIPNISIVGGDIVCL